MRVLHVISSLEIGGAQRLLSDLLPIMQRLEGIDVSLLVLREADTDFRKKIAVAGIPIISMNVKNVQRKSYSLRYF